MSVTTAKLLTAEDALHLDLDYPWELVRGEIVEITRPKFHHGIVCGHVYWVLRSWLEQGHVGFVSTNDTGLITQRDPDSVRGPDLFYISHSRLPHMPPDNAWLEVAPELCVEVVSENDCWTDLNARIEEYLAVGVLEVWIVDPELRMVHIYATGASPRILRVSDTLDSPKVLPGFTCGVADFFTGL